ncbi:MAG: 3'(2'),5'-bisphosphate nucleotidase CysQ [Chloroflexota bacterium]
MKMKSLDSQSIQELLTLAENATQRAGEVICSYYRSAYQSWDKRPDNPVTTADMEADQLLRETLTSATPDFGWLSEETRDTPERLGRRFTWVVDPLDGTKEFIQGLDQFAVSVALVDNGQPLLGVVYNPATKEMFTSSIEQGVQLNGHAAQAFSSRQDPNGASVLASNTEIQRGMWEPYTDKFKVVEVGSAAYKLARVAAGMGDAYISLNPKNEWDICAGTALVLSAGGTVTDLSGAPLRFNQERTLVQGLVAANSTLHRGIVDLIVS